MATYRRASPMPIRISNVTDEPVELGTGECADVRLDVIRKDGGKPVELVICEVIQEDGEHTADVDS